MTEKIEVSQRARKAAAELAAKLGGAISIGGNDLAAIMNGLWDNDEESGYMIAFLVPAFARFEHETRLAGERAGMERAAEIAEDVEFYSADDIAQAIRAEAGDAHKSCTPSLADRERIFANEPYDPPATCRRPDGIAPASRDTMGLVQLTQQGKHHDLFALYAKKWAGK